MILKFRTKGVTELLKHFRELTHIDKLKLAIHLLENSNLIDNTKEISRLEELLINLDSSYVTTIVNFSKYKNLIFLSAKFIELSVIEQKDFIEEMLKST